VPTAQFGDADAQAVIDTYGVSVTIGGVTAKGLLRISDEPLAMSDQAGKLMATQATVLALTATFISVLAQGIAAIVDGVSYKVVDFVRESSGFITRIYLAKP
jgi:hypothetical protein